MHIIPENSYSYYRNVNDFFSSSLKKKQGTVFLIE